MKKKERELVNRLRHILEDFVISGECRYMAKISHKLTEKEFVDRKAILTDFIEFLFCK